MTGRRTWWLIKHKKTNKFAIDEHTEGPVLYNTKPTHLHPDWEAEKVNLVDFSGDLGTSSNKKVKEFKQLVDAFLKTTKDLK